MSYRTLTFLRRVAVLGIRVSLSGYAAATVVLLASAMTVSAQDPLTILQTGKALAENMPTDIVRLALLTSVVSQLAFVAFVVASQKTMRQLLQKPCVLHTTLGKAVMRDAVHDAAQTPDR